MKANELFDVIIIGGSYAGLSAAMSLGRSLKKTLVIDSGKPCNAQTPQSHNFLTQDGKPPQEIAALGKQQVEQYDTVKFFNDIAVKAIKTDTGFLVSTRAGTTFQAKKLILASGIKDMLPDIPGFSNAWGISVIHCPYCHGYEYRDQLTGIYANGDRALHLASLVGNLTNELTILTNGPAEFTQEQSDLLARRHIPVLESPILAIEQQNGHLQQLILKDGTHLPMKALYAAVPFVQHTDIPLSLGCEMTTSGHLQVDSFQKTTIPGVWACGDNSSPMRAVSNAVATGALAGAMVNMELTQESFNRTDS
ncbi:NAD(P)/FAD-dependent oxidoreductase [Pedobacter sp. CAN_A7]|uniref:NAD(P)/FAD-dependent oxidoreductase n=1 Tax=Pedobacter sp. CAN_A7 TaxID=2787722 RepID=UPI0018C9D0CF